MKNAWETGVFAVFNSHLMMLLFRRCWLPLLAFFLCSLTCMYGKVPFRGDKRGSPILVVSTASKNTQPLRLPTTMGAQRDRWVYPSENQTSEPASGTGGPQECLAASRQLRPNRLTPGSMGTLGIRSRHHKAQNNSGQETVIATVII